MTVKALVADDHPLFRLALKQAVLTTLGDDIAEASTLDEALNALQKDADIELVFLDLNMPGSDGLTGLSQIRHQFPDVLVVIVSAVEDPHMIKRAMSLGSSGFIPKSAPLEEISQAIRWVLEGHLWVPEELEKQLGEAPDDTEQDFINKLDLLTPQQFVVLRMMADGLLNKQIAYELGIKETTIKQHGSAILRKLGLNNRTQAGVLFKQVMGKDNN